VENNNLNTKDLTGTSFAIISGKENSNSGAAAPGDSIAITKLSANTLECQVETINPRLLVFLQNIISSYKQYV